MTDAGMANLSDLDRLRRFALAAALLLITFVTASIFFLPDANILPLGIPFRVGRPELLPIGLALASFYGALRFYFYGFVLAASPYRLRRVALTEFSSRARTPLSMYFTSGRRSPILLPDRNTGTYMAATAAAEGVTKLYLQVARARAEMKTIGGHSRSASEALEGARIEVHIPLICRLAVLLRDVDYAAPVWFNAISLSLYAWSIRGVVWSFVN